MSKVLTVPEGMKAVFVPFWLRASAVLFLMTLLYYRIFFIPAEGPTVPDFESGWQGAMEYAAFYGIPFGKQIFFNFGPLGYLASAMGMGLMGPACIVFAGAWTLLVCVCVLDFHRAASAAGALLLGAWLFIFHHPHNVYDYEFQPMLVLLILSHGVFFMPAPKVRMLALAVVLAVFSVMKGSFIPPSLVMVTLFFLVSLHRNRVREALFFAGAYAFFVVFVWTLAGQPLSGLFPWILSVLRIIRGYAESQALSGDPLVFKLGISGVLVFSFFAAALICRLRRNFAAVAFIVFVSFLVLMQWRHAFVRADTHLFFLTRFLPAAFLMFSCREFWPAARSRSYGLFFAAGFFAVTALSLLTNDRLTENVRYQPHRRLEPLAASFGRLERLLLHGLTFPAAGKEGCGVNPDCQLDKIRQFAGTRSVDAYNNDLAVVFLNGLRYWPRPMLQGFGAVTADLQQLNLDGYRRIPPDLVLVRMAAMDRHFPATNDAPLLLFLLHNARPVFAEKRFLLFEFFRQNMEMPSGSNVWRGRVPFGKIVSLEKWNHEPLVLRIRMRRTLWGNLKLAFFRAGATQLHIQSGKSAFIPYRLIGGMAEKGFLISPMLLSNQQVLSLSDPEGGRRARAFLVTHDRSQFPEYEEEYDLEVDAVPELVDAAAWKTAMDALPGRMFQGLETYQGPVPLKIVFAADFAGALAPPSSRLVLKIPEGAAQVQGQFAMMDSSYEEGARTHGVRFMAEVEDSRGRIRPALDRVLDPFGHPSERGASTYRIELQPGDRRLVLRTEPGPEGPSEWDLSVWMPPEFDAGLGFRGYPAFRSPPEDAA